MIPRLRKFLKGRSGPESMSPRYWLFRVCVMLLMKVLVGFRCYGSERVPGNGPLVVASNHSQNLDPVYVCLAVPRRVQWMAKKELFVFPLKSVFALLGAFPVDRQGGGRAAIRTATEHLKKGWTLGIFPEGTRNRDGVYREPKSGAVLLASRSGARVLPIYVETAPGLWGRLRGERLHAYIGEPLEIDAELRGGKAYREASEKIMREIYALPERFGSSDASVEAEA